MIDGPTRAMCFVGAVATVVVGIIHAVISFHGSTTALGWSSGGFFDEINDSWQQSFLLTPEQIAKHWQPLVLGLIALGQHVRVMYVWNMYTTWIWAAIFYLFVACFGCFGFAGNAGIIAGSICLVASFMAFCMACLDASSKSSALTQPLFG